MRPICQFTPTLCRTLVTFALAAHLVGHLGPTARAARASENSDGGETTSQHFIYTDQSLNPDVPPAIEDLLAEHERVTGEEIQVHVWPPTTPGAAETPPWTPEVLAEKIRSLQIGARSSGRGILITLDPARRDAQVTLAFGMVDRLSLATLDALKDEVARPYLKQDAIGEAALAITIATLRELDSPLIESGRWQTAIGLFPRANEVALIPDAERSLSTRSVAIVALITAMVFLFAAALQLGAEAHFTAHGWTRYRAWDIRAWVRKRTQTPGPSETGGFYGHW